MNTTTTTAAALPTWDDMSDVDKGCALLHMWKRSWEGASYAAEEYPARYLDDPRLVALPLAEACRHAVAVCGSHAQAFVRLGEDEHQRLYDLALAEPDRRCLWGARDPATGRVAAPTYDPTEAGAREVLAAWAARGEPGVLVRRDEPGGDWVEVPA